MDKYIGTIRIFAALVWSEVFLFLAKYGVEFSSEHKEILEHGSAIIAATLFYFFVQWASQYKFFQWLQWFFLVAKAPHYGDKDGNIES